MIRNAFKGWGQTADTPGFGRVPSADQRGAPVPFSFRQRKPVGPRMSAFAGPMYLHSRPYSRGADAYSPKFGYIPINPIGAGFPSRYRMPTITGPGAQYQNGAIWFAPQTIPTSIVMNSTVPIETINALLATTDVRGTYTGS